ncbi:MAG: hypothetical protein ABIJ47_01290 [Candidatus Bathyarchaeota archaeon]
MGDARIALAMTMVATLLLPIVYGAQDYTPQGLTLTVFPDGTAKVEYAVESNPNRLRVAVQLFGAPFINMVIRDETGNPLGSTASGDTVTVDSIGASQLTFSYFSRSLASQEGPTWCVNVTSPVETRVVLPEGAALFDMSEVPIRIGAAGSCQYIDFSPGEICVYYMVGLLKVQEEALESINKTEAYIVEKEAEGYILGEAGAALEQSKSLFAEGEFLASRNGAVDALDVAMITVDRAISAADMVEKAQAAVDQAALEGQTKGLNQAEAGLASAQALYSSGEYVKATAAAAEAYQKAVSASKPVENPFTSQLIIAGAVLSFIGYFFFKSL